MKKYLFIYRSLRTKINAIITIILSIFATMPDKAKLIIGEIFGNGLVKNHWDLIIAIVAILGMVIHAHGTVRPIATTPVDER